MKVSSPIGGSSNPSTNAAGQAAAAAGASGQSGTGASHVDSLHSLDPMTVLRGSAHAPGGLLPDPPQPKPNSIAGTLAGAVALGSALNGIYDLMDLVSELTP